MPLSAPISVQLDISKHWTDEEIILLLGRRRRIGDPTLANAIIGVDPFSMEPTNSSEESWYLYNLEGLQYPNRRSAIIETKSGFWKIKDDCRIFTNTTSVGRKTTMEFYKGKVPSEKRTGWMMHEYQAEGKTLNGSNETKDYNSLCRVFLQNDWTDYMQLHSSTSADAGGVCVEQLLPIFEEPEERNLPPENVLNRSLGQSAFSESLGEPLNENIAKDTNVTCDFLIEDYLELDDIYNPGTSSELRTVAVDEKGQMAISGSLGEPLNENIMEDIYSNGEYLELNDLCSPEMSSGLRTVAVDEKGQMAFSGSLGEPLNENIMEDFYSNGEYLELNDLCSPEMSSGLRTVAVDEKGQMAFSGSLGEPLNENIMEDFYSNGEYLELNDLCSPEMSSGLRTVSVDYQGQSAFSQSLIERVNENIMKHLFATYEFSNGDCLELNDLFSPEISSFSSENSSCMSVNSYDYPNADALLCYTGEDGNLRVEEEHIDHRFGISVIAESNQIVIKPSSPGRVHSNSNVVVEESRPAISLPGNGISCQGLPISNDELQHKRNDSKAGKSEGSPTNQAADDSHGGKSMQGNALKKISKIAKLGKKCCCFGSF